MERGAEGGVRIYWRCTAARRRRVIPSVVAAIIGIVLIVLFTIGLALIKTPTGDTTIQPEGEPDPGVPNSPGRPTYR
jgi:hypothetical protein